MSVLLCFFICYKCVCLFSCYKCASLSMSLFFFRNTFFSFSGAVSVVSTTCQGYSRRVSLTVTGAGGVVGGGRPAQKSFELEHQAS